MKNIILFLVISFSIIPAWAEFEDCDSKLSSALGKLIAADTKGVLALQFKITTLKATKHLLGSSHPTLEATLAADKDKFKAINEADPAVMTKLNQLFDLNGGDKHTEALKARVASLKVKSADASYWKSDKRLSNEDVSTYLMMDKLNNPQSDVNQQDIAITWYMNKVSENIAQTKGRNSYAHNLSLLSVKLARNLGQIRGIASVTAAQADTEIASAQSTINEFLTSSLAAIKKQIPECFKDDKFKGTEVCDVNYLNNALASFLVNVQDVNALIAPVAAPTTESPPAPLTPGLAALPVASASGQTQLQPQLPVAGQPGALVATAPATTPLASSAPTSRARTESRTVASRRPAAAVVRPRHHPDPARRDFQNKVVNAIYSGSLTRLTCPGGKVVSVKATDLNNGSGNFRYTILTASRLETLKRELDSGKQISCMKNLVMNQCYPEVKVDRSRCFY